MDMILLLGLSAISVPKYYCTDIFQGSNHSIDFLPGRKSIQDCPAVVVESGR